MEWIEMRQNFLEGLGSCARPSGYFECALHRSFPYVRIACKRYSFHRSARARSRRAGCVCRCRGRSPLAVPRGDPHSCSQ